MKLPLSVLCSVLAMPGCINSNYSDTGKQDAAIENVSSREEAVPGVEEKNIPVTLYEPSEDSVWYFLTQKDSVFVIEQSEEMPLMKIYIENPQGLLNVSYGQEGFLFYIQNISREGNSLIYSCLSAHDQNDSMNITAETVSPRLVIWKVPNPYTADHDVEIIYTAPESRKSDYPMITD